MSIKRKIFLVVWMVVLAFLVLSGARYFIAARTRSAVSSCRALLKQIEGAKTTWALEHQKTAEDVPSDSDLFGPDAYISKKPLCPRGGTYTIGRVGEEVRCTFPEHRLDYGRVLVIDEARNPIVGAEISIQGYDYETAADGTSTAPISLRPKWIIVSKSGYYTERVEVPNEWPLTITLKPRPASHDGSRD